jgi:hypothetical protein
LQIVVVALSTDSVKVKRFDAEFDGASFAANRMLLTGLVQKLSAKNPKKLELNREKLKIGHERLDRF